MSFFRSIPTLAVLLATALSGVIAAEERPLKLTISEFFIDSPERRDQNEYLEIAGPPHMKLTEAAASGEFTYYLLMLENQRSDAGKVDKVIPLAGAEINPRGYAWFYGAGGEEYPYDGGYAYEGMSENSGCTLLLAAVPFGQSAPDVAHNYHAAGGVAILGGDWNPAWIVLDGVGVMCRKKDVAEGGALYASVNFAAGDFAQIATPSDAVNVKTDAYKPGERGAFDKIDYVGRNQEGIWFAANLINEGPGWDAEFRNYLVAADAENDGEPECVDQYGTVPYKVFHEITVTFGKRALCNCSPGPQGSSRQLFDRPDGPVPTLAEPIDQQAGN
jgi:hypothetical protein